MIYTPEKSPKPDKKAGNHIYSTTIPVVLNSSFDTQKNSAEKHNSKRTYFNDNQQRQKRQKIFVHKTSEPVSSPLKRTYEHYVEIAGGKRANKKIEWNRSTKIDNLEIIKGLKNEVMDLRSENKRMKEELRESKKIQRQFIQRKLFEKEKNTQFVVSQNPQNQYLLLSENKKLKEENVALFSRIQQLQKESKMTKVQINELENLEIKNRQSFIECSKDLEDHYIKKINNLEELVKKMNKQINQNQKTMKQLLFQRHKDITTTMNRTKAIQNQLKPIYGDNQEPFEPEDQKGQEVKIPHYEEMIEKQKQKYQQIFAENRKLSNEILKIKNEMTSLKNQNENLKSESSQNLKLSKNSQNKTTQKETKIVKILAKVKQVKEVLSTCPPENFDTMNQEFLYLMKQKHHLSRQFQQYQKVNENKKAWQLQKSLNDEKKKNKQLVTKCLDLQNYIQKRISQKEKDFISEGIYDSYYVHECTCQFEDKNGQQAIRWNQYVKNCLSQTNQKLDNILSNS